MLLSCYRQGEAADPAAYITGIAAVLSRFPKAVVDAVVDPRTGIQTRKTWPPNPAEVREACEIAHAPILAAEAREAAARRVAEFRAAEQEAPRAVRPSYDDLKAKHGPNWGINPPPDPVTHRLSFYRSDRPLTAEERVAMYAERGRG